MTKRSLVVMLALGLVGCSSDGASPTPDGGVFPTPEEVLEPPTGEAMIEVEDGVLVPAVAREVVVFFAPDATPDVYDSVIEAATEFEAAAVGQIPEVGLLQLRTVADEDILPLSARLRTLSGILRADANYIYGTSLEPQCPVGGTTECDDDGFWWYRTAPGVSATTAWDIVGETDSVVCLVEGPPDDNSDLYGGVTPEDITPALLQDDDPPDEHATQVLSLMVAPGNDGEESLGVAWRAPVLSFDAAWPVLNSATIYWGSSRDRVGELKPFSDRRQRAGEDLQPQVLLVA